ncbi:MAG: diheme cytochrome c-553 [Bacteroidetes bacterium]|nr:diheme cytochrome c-553 [Bacteroidota bacterium]
MRIITLSMVCAFSLILLSNCKNKATTDSNSPATSNPGNYNGFGSQIAWGQHLVRVSGCNDCHTPKMMTARGPADDTTKLLSGHPEKVPAPEVDRKAMESKGLAVTNTLTVWVGPWGISYAANLTSDPTGIGNWNESNFITSMRNGKFKGISNERDLLPPMPWQWYKYMTDDELKAIFAYLKSTKPIHNIVPEAVPPALAQMR